MGTQERDSTQGIEVFHINSRPVWIAVWLFVAVGIGFAAFLLLSVEAPNPETILFALGTAIAWIMAAIFIGWVGLAFDGPVVSIGPQGVFDRRLMRRPLGWEEIRGIEIVEHRFRYHVTADTRFIALAVDDVEAVRLRSRFGMTGLAAWVFRLPVIGIQVSGLRPSEAEALAAFVRHCPPELWELEAAKEPPQESSLRK